jgi:UDP-2,3-diacylglucosamine hydrolase
MSRYAMIAGNGRFPLLALETARAAGDEVVVVAIKEEAAPEVEQLAKRCYWISLGQLSRLIEILKEEKVGDVMMAGQVKHAKIFSTIRPDWKLVKLLASLKQKNTDALIGGVAQILADEGIRLADSTLLLKPLLAGAGVLSIRKPIAEEERDIAYGRKIASALAGLDVGQSVAICDGACVAVEAMEGTDAMLARAASLVNGKPLRLVKVSRRRKHLLFDVPVAGPGTIEAMHSAGATALAVDAGRTLLLDRDAMLARANELRIAIIGCEPEQ